TAASPEFILSRKGTYIVKLESNRGGKIESTTQEIVVQNDPAMKALYLFSNNWSDSSDFGNDISSGHGLLRADPDRKNNARSCINMGTSGGALFLPDDLLRNTGNATTLSMWIKANTVIKNPLFGYWKGDEPALVNTPSVYFDETGKLRLKFANGTVAPQLTVEGLNADTWYHIVLTGSGTEQQVYVNGELKGSMNSDAINHGTMNTAALGYMYTPANSSWAGLPGATWSSYNFKGYFDDVRIYNKMLSAKEVQALFEE
ncbi:MAG TPA: LamG domain-containing protein, partial [Ferruginibacter sp.]|nr:LamG domain-containing protein [Ferruginibacter sp.]